MGIAVLYDQPFSSMFVSLLTILKILESVGKNTVKVRAAKSLLSFTHCLSITYLSVMHFVINCLYQTGKSRDCGLG